ncbi:hypothetical protein [Martelella soudanensis]|uniref:hypothetical protein n=1 Tax=unclassified Martelella TaxID=2629616 RepID=UPI0015E026E8|nr:MULTISPECIES: hypothetical protein [unclassified Martelella]
MTETAVHISDGLGHSFEDRMLAVGLDECIRRDLMGHSLNRKRYGQGASLEHVQGLLSSLSL